MFGSVGASGPDDNGNVLLLTGITAVDAEFGFSAGATMSVAMRSGTNA